MGYATIVLISLGLSVDSFAASISCGLGKKKVGIKNIIKTSLIFGGFQGAMPVIGWLIGSSFKKIITGMDHWIAFSLLLFIGLKMIYESQVECTKKGKGNEFKTSNLALLGIATSIDALAVGISFAILDISIIKAAVIIGITTMVVTIIGLKVGNKIGKILGKNVQIIGGIVLIGIGIKILIEHLS